MPKKNKKIFLAYLDVAKDKLDSAKILYKNKKYDDSVSRAYYAVFHCAQALLVSLAIKAESHTGVRQLFGLHFIKEGRFEKKFGRYLKNLKDERENGDYGIFTMIEKKDAQKALEEASEFISATEKYLKEKGFI